MPCVSLEIHVSNSLYIMSWLCLYSQVFKTENKLTFKFKFFFCLRNKLYIYCFIYAYILYMYAIYIIYGIYILFYIYATYAIYYKWYIYIYILFLDEQKCLHMYFHCIISDCRN